MTNAKFVPNEEPKLETTPEMYFLHTKMHDMNSDGTKTKGYEYKFPLSKASIDNKELQEMQILGHAHKF